MWSRIPPIRSGMYSIKVWEGSRTIYRATVNVRAMTFLLGAGEPHQISDFNDLVFEYVEQNPPA